MVTLSDVQSSNSFISSTLPPDLVAVFIGATSGIGETSLKQFAKYSRQSRVYLVGRSQNAGDRIVDECKALSSEGEYICEGGRELDTRGRQGVRGDQSEGEGYQYTIPQRRTSQHGS